jgi:hypothetical protein
VQPAVVLKLVEPQLCQVLGLPGLVLADLLLIDARGLGVVRLPVHRQLSLVGLELRGVCGEGAGVYWLTTAYVAE